MHEINDNYEKRRKALLGRTPKNVDEWFIKHLSSTSSGEVLAACANLEETLKAGA